MEIGNNEVLSLLNLLCIVWSRVSQLLGPLCHLIFHDGMCSDRPGILYCCIVYVVSQQSSLLFIFPLHIIALL